MSLDKSIESIVTYIFTPAGPSGIQLFFAFGIVITLALQAVGPDLGPLALVLGLVFSAFVIILIWTTHNDAQTGHQLRSNQKTLANFLNLPSDEQPNIGVFVARSELMNMPLRSGETTPYQVNVMAEANVIAAFELYKMLAIVYSHSEVFPYQPPEVRFVRGEENAKRYEKHVIFLVGGPLANPLVENMVAKHGQIQLKAMHDENGEQLHIVCQSIDQTFHIHPASKGRTLDEVERQSTYGCVIKERVGTLTRVAVWGLDERGTRCTAAWLASRWKSFSEGFPDHAASENFTVILHIPGAIDIAEDPVRLEGVPNIFIPKRPFICEICQSK